MYLSMHKKQKTYLISQKKQNCLIITYPLMPVQSQTTYKPKLDCINFLALFGYKFGTPICRLINSASSLFI